VAKRAKLNGVAEFLRQQSQVVNATVLSFQWISSSYSAKYLSGKHINHSHISKKHMSQQISIQPDKLQNSVVASVGKLLG